MDFGSTKMPIPFLILSPRGISPYALLPNLLPELSKKIAKGLKLGSDYLHSHDIVHHNDISFKNFILVKDTNEPDGVYPYTAVIIDVGSAEHVNNPMERIVGT